MAGVEPAVLGRAAVIHDSLLMEGCVPAPDQNKTNISKQEHDMMQQILSKSSDPVQALHTLQQLWKLEV